MRKNLTNYFLIIFLLYSLNELLKYLLNFDKLLLDSLAEKMLSSQISQFFESQERWQWISYIFVPLYVLLKIIIITSIVYIGTFFFSKKQIAYKDIFSIILIAEFIFLLVPVFKIIWFYFFETDYKLEDIQYFYPFSAINITGYNGLEPWLIYPFQALNLFELAYVMYLANQLGKVTETNDDTGYKIICYSYVPMMILWIVVVMFFTLNYT